MREFDFFYDLGSPYSYLASTQLAGIEQRGSARARLYPITLGGIRKVTGNQMPPPAQLKYMSHDTARWAKQYGVRMQIPQAFPVSTIKALRACIAAGERHREVMHALFDIYWGEGLDISDVAVLEKALSAFDASKLLAESQEVKDELRKNTDLALARGVFGVPTIFVGERSFWGNDRLDWVERELKR